MDLWEYTKMAAPIIGGAFVISFVIVEAANALRWLVNYVRPRGRDED